MTRGASRRLQDALGYDKMEPCRRAVSGIHRFPSFDERRRGARWRVSCLGAERRVTQHLITMNSHRALSLR